MTATSEVFNATWRHTCPANSCSLLLNLVGY